MTTQNAGQKGFTLPELLVVGLLIGLLLFAALKVAHPLDFSAKRRNGERWVAVAHQMDILKRYVADKGELPPGIPEEKQTIGSELGMVNLCPLFVPKYAKDMPKDPVFAQSATKDGCETADAIYTTGLAIEKTKDNKVTISAPGAEKNEKISLSQDF